MEIQHAIDSGGVLSYLQTTAKERAGNVAFQSFEEVWAALGRLYDDIVKVQESQRQIVLQQQQTAEQLAKVTTELDRVIERIDQVTERIDRLAEGHERVNSMLATLAGHVTQVTIAVESHERRLARMEGQ